MKSFLPIILIVVSVGLFFFQVNPLYSDVKTLRAEATQYDEALKMAEQLKKIRIDLAHTLVSFSVSDLARLDHFLPRNLDTVRIIMDIDAIAARSGVRLTQLDVADPAPATASKTNPSAVAGKGGYNTVDILLSFTGFYDQGQLFIEDLQRSLRLLDSTGLSIKPGTTPGYYIFTMNLQTYWINR
jgi:Tfp pilus assembly protein PilO